MRTSVQSPTQDEAKNIVSFPKIPIEETERLLVYQHWPKLPAKVQQRIVRLVMANGAKVEALA